MYSNLIQTLKKMYKDPDYAEVNDARIQLYVQKQMITAEEAKYIKGEIADE